MSSKNKPSGNRLPQSAKTDPTAEVPFRPDRVTGLSVSHESYSGPLPHPIILEGYERVVPGSAEKIVEAFFLQANHRMELEKIVVTGGDRRADRGQWMGFFIALLVLGTGTYLAAVQHLVTAGGVFGGVGLAALVAVFVYGERTRSQEREQKEKVRLEMRKDSSQRNSG